MSSERFDSFSLATFTCDDPFQLRSPRWARLDDAELARLVGTAVDAERGSGYVPRPPDPEDDTRYRTIWVARLPRPTPFRADTCMPQGIGTGRALIRQLPPAGGHAPAAGITAATGTRSRRTRSGWCVKAAKRASATPACTASPGIGPRSKGSTADGWGW
ncbi:hypothetical protein ACFQ08_07705 [Streptosporangium algeriense]|uniref:Uncharacterized protein n=1 Tax=Streptosporangium algeriense TaxID=1682748 RepID=A0ABW3DP67_9ACTN